MLNGVIGVALSFLICSTDSAEACGSLPLTSLYNRAGGGSSEILPGFAITSLPQAMTKRTLRKSRGVVL